MRTQIEVGAIGNAHQLVPLPLLLFALRKEAILNIHGALGVMRQLFLRLFVKAQVAGRDADIEKPLPARIDPFLVRLFIFAGPDEIFHLHLLELARAKDEIAGGDLVAKRFADLRHTEGQFTPAGIQHVEKVYKDALRGFGTQIDERIGVILCRSADVRAKHQIEGSQFRKTG